MMGVRFDWKGDAAKSYFEQRAAWVLEQVLVAAVAHAQELTATQGPPRSVPGEPPHRDKGPLHDLMHFEIMIPGEAGRFGSPAPEAYYTEVGTSRMAARPWLRPTLDWVTENFAALTNRPMAEAG